ncbi:LysR family transcriptional regulator [Pseudonocardia asaccharolytica DSM 44247 = NBRC 16224]|uniref:LysR family transcriptional regulator n=1 Tax=Pseudonocardia asaccharolytica DSM 44247 = NBRC 16224 TaxID=1123024 RepID=A0A511D7Y3_9PSEU|nr:LysR family transcriptional regulator [Pseudonocardia asaccharolytica DSM 44247 = NBRC 16224]
MLIRQLEYLVALGREQHFGRAAAVCYVSQPALSAAIRKLENELDVTIVLRGRRFEGFTDEGRRVVGWAHRILAERDALLADLDRMRNGLRATVRIGAIPTAVPATPLMSSLFSTRYPLARVRIESLSSREISRRLAEFELDAGVTYLDNDTPPGTRSVELYRERYRLLVPADDELARESVVEWAAAAALPHCALMSTMRNRRVLDANMAAAGATLVPVVETDTVGALYAHIATRRLASIVAHTWLHAFGVPEGMCVRPLAEVRPRPAVGLIVSDREPTSIVVDALVDALSGADLSEALERSLPPVIPG